MELSPARGLERLVARRVLLQPHDLAVANDEDVVEARVMRASPILLPLALMLWFYFVRPAHRRRYRRAIAELPRWELRPQ